MKTNPLKSVAWKTAVLGMGPVLAGAMIMSGPAQAAHHEKASAAVDIAQTRAALASAPGRSDADKERDAGRKPSEVLHFLGLKPGDTAFDVLASGGWYSEALSIAVGPEGKVYAQNPAVLLQMRDGANDKALTARLADNRLPNVVRLDEEMTALSIPPNSVDVAITGLNLHDVYNSFGEQATIGFLTAVKATLKPGGVFGVIDHVGKPGADNTPLHRMDPALAVRAAEAAGFMVEQGTMLANPQDDHTGNVFGPDLRGKTDRFVLKLTKPKPGKDQ
ncbi:Predicted methyltransferase [Parasphingorhabdus marina DSM 22363]|uniref:Predicted methyltransferase n=1 Tax=Parasphingorhabdus marina DSM 22363 TaxID=1123272 RepID=A0A1N6CS39_9SPHN|nr:class I SAM-dependent methyltransferase [Parasphingorhabdus marina]SIN61297.1 Predicted methyltransferase [Parasphingorhabdus marina DSM 22363]